MNTRHTTCHLFSLALVALLATGVVADQASIEAELLAVLESQASPAEKAITCKKLAIHGSPKAVPALAKLLPDPQLSSWARIAIEAIPGAEADEALRKASESLDGRLLVGMINSIGVRRDQKAVQSLSLKLRHADVEVASAAAVALGNIGNATATKSLQDALANVPAKVRSAVAEGCVLCAERLHRDGNSAAATQLYDKVRRADVPIQRIIEATRGAILARKQDGIPLLIQTLQSTDKRLFQLALGTVREFPGDRLDNVLAAEMLKAKPERAALIVQAMADRDTVVLPALLQVAAKGPKSVRLSAIDALRRVGDDSCIDTLLTIAVDSDAELSQTAKETLASISGEQVDARIATLLPAATGKTYLVLIELVGQRRIDAVPALLSALERPEEDIRHAALISLGETVSLKRLPVLISQVVAPKHPEDRDVAQLALKAASVRIPDREACANELTDALQDIPAATQSVLLEILSEVGGTKTLQTLAVSAKAQDPLLQDTSSRLLGKWNSIDAAPVLLDLAKTGPAEKFQVRALRGYIGLARKFAMPENQRAEMCQRALDASRRLEERKLVLEVLKLHPSAAALKLAVNAMKDPELKAEATPVAMLIADKVGGKGADVRQLLAGVGLDQVKLEIIKAVYGAGTKQKDVTAIVRKRARNLPVIALSADTFNASFGGDPAPGVVKQLKIQYRINGKPGEASFAENALIVLPIPE